MRRPFLRKESGCWYVWRGKKCVNLGSDEAKAFSKWEQFQAKPAGDVSHEAVAALLNRFLDWTQKNRAPQTYRWYRDYLRSFARHIGKRLSIAELSESHVEEWIELEYPEASDSHVRGAMGSVQRAMNWAVKRKLLVASPIVGLERPTPGRREILISTADRKRIFDATPDQAFRDFLTVLFEAGCRPQEARLARVEYFDRRGKRWVFPLDESKGKKHRRVVYLTDSLVELSERLAARVKAGPLLRNTDGDPWTASAVTCRFKRLAKKLSFPGLCAYAVRHTFCTNRLIAGVDPVTVSVLMGHRDTTMVARTYQHLGAVPGHLHAALRKDGIPPVSA